MPPRRGAALLALVMMGLLLPLAVGRSPAAEASASQRATSVSSLQLDTTIRVGDTSVGLVRVSGPVGRPVLLQFREPGQQWRTVVTLATNREHRVRVKAAVTAAVQGRLVWQAVASKGEFGPTWAVAGRTKTNLGVWRVKVPTIGHWARAVSPRLRMTAVAPPVWIRRVSVSGSGQPSNEGSYVGALSADGQVVVFRSSSSNLVPGDSNDTVDVFVRDWRSQQTTRVSVSSTGVQANEASEDSAEAAISADGRVVAFVSSATNLVTGDTNGVADVFVHDRQTGETTRVSVSSDGGQAPARPGSWASSPALSRDGRFVAFSVEAALVPEDTNGHIDLYVHDRTTGETSRVSVSSTGVQANDSNTWVGSLSADGQIVAFQSMATSLIPGDTTSGEDVFVHDRRTGETTRVSVSSSGAAGNGPSVWPRLSADGRLVAFASYASNLVAGDTNRESDVFVHDRTTGKTIRVSTTPADTQSTRASFIAGISDDGRYVTFTNGKTVYQRDLAAGSTHAVLAGLAPMYDYPVASTNGRFVLTPSRQRHLTPHIPSRFTAQETQMYLAKFR